jgi:hypothetical protein
MSAYRQALDPCQCADPHAGDGDPKEKKIIRDEEKSREQLIDELFELRQRIAELEDAQEKRLSFVQGEINFVKGLPKRLTHVKTLTGLLPICTSCKRIRDDQGYWNQLEIYIREHSEAEFTHGLCPECVKKFYPVDILTRASDDPQSDNK